MAVISRAWYALYKWFRPLRRAPYYNFVVLYKTYLYDEWFESLTDAEQEQERLRSTMAEARRKQRLDDCINNLYALGSIMYKHNNGRIY